MRTRAAVKKAEKKQLTIRSEYVAFRDIEESPVNAQEMTEGDFSRLVKNLKRDGILTSAPLLMDQEGKTKKMCISGHHRIKAAIKAGIEGAISLVSEELDESTRVRIQLTHNDIHGDPNMDIVAVLMQQLSEFDITLVDTSGIEGLVEDAKEMDVTVPQFRYINVCLIEESREKLVDLIMHLEKEDTENWLISKPEYDNIRDLLTYAFEKGFKTPGQAFGNFMEIVENHRDEIKR